MTSPATPDEMLPPSQPNLASLLRPAPALAEDARSSAFWLELKARATDEPEFAALARQLEIPAVESIIKSILYSSPYLQGLIVRDLARLQGLLSAPPDAHVTSLVTELWATMAAAANIADAMRHLRVFKAEIALLTALADLGGVWPLMRVTGVLTEAADAAVQSSVRFLFKLAAVRGDWIPAEAQTPEAGSGYIVLGMGKYGAHELNYSSDIDLIIFYDSLRATLRPGLETPDFFIRLTRDLVRLIEERTRDGYVFRTDLRLRPDAGATQIALSTDAGLHYYETVGQNWERAAMIKARAVAGDRAAGRAFLDELTPFIWRKYLDFAAIADVHAMKRQIHAHKGFGSIGVAGHNIKLGRGGIREIEFFAQTQQLIAGGRQPSLRTPQTLEALQALVAKEWISPAVARSLSAAYVYLRTIEHRLQMVADEQTHELPAASADLDRFARFAGSPTTEAFSSELVAVLETVQGHYSRLFEAAPQLTSGAANMVFAGEADDPATTSALEAMGYSQPAVVLATVRGWHHGRYRAMRSPKARERLTQVQPILVEALAATADPDQALANFDRFLTDLPSGVQLFALLRTKPGLLQIVADIMGSAPRLARILSRRRRLFDAVLDPAAFGSVPGVAAYQRLITEAIKPTDDLETVLDAARILGSEQMFLIGLRMLAGTLTATAAGTSYAALAECLIETLKVRIERDLKVVHGGFPGGAAVVVALGKLGGREMTATSDLDIMLIYDVPPEALTGSLLSDGPKPLSAGQYYARLTQRLVAALSAPTSEGTLYDVDLRLRPSGQKGPLATSLPSFIEYQLTEAWTWERMALTRARVLTGPEPLKSKVQAAIATVLGRPRDVATMARDVREMRARMAAEKGTDDMWDMKQVRGGLVDLEFIAQYAQLKHAATHPGVLDTNTRAALTKLADAGLLDQADSEALRAAALLLTNLVGILRLMTDGPFAPQSASRGLRDRLSRAGEAPSFPALEAALKQTLERVHAAFDRLIVA